MKKLIPILALMLALFALTGCEEEASKTTHATNINSTEKTVKESPKKGIARRHTLTVQGQTLTLTSSYQVDERNLNNYVFTTPSVIDESLKLDADARFKVRVTNLYSDVTVSSKYSRYNGLRQDSMNLDNSSTDGMAISLPTIVT